MAAGGAERRPAALMCQGSATRTASLCATPVSFRDIADPKEQESRQWRTGRACPTLVGASRDAGTASRGWRIRLDGFCRDVCAPTEEEKASGAISAFGEGAGRLAVVELEVLLPDGRFTAGDGQSAVRTGRGPQPHEGRIHPDKERQDVCATRGRAERVVGSSGSGDHS